MREKDNDFSIRIINGKSEEEHFHQEIEIVYILEGKIILNLEENKYTMNKNSLVLINSNKKHSLKVIDNVLICKIYINYRIISNILNNKFIDFWCNSIIYQDKNYDKLRSIINKIIKENTINNGEISFYQKSLVYWLLEYLEKEFLIQSNNKWSNGEDERIDKVIEYINENYFRSITLNEISSQIYMSDTSFSRYFKKTTGVNFVEYVNRIRIYYAVEKLLYSNKSITTIAQECGFSSASSFNKVFKEIYNMAPTYYRNKSKELSSIDSNSNNIDVKKDVQKFLNQIEEVKKIEINKEYIVINRDDNKYKLNDKNMCIDFGSASDLLGGKPREHLLQLKEEIGFKYVRISNIFSKEMYVRRGEGVREFNFNHIDNVLDYIIELDMYPIIDFTNKPKRANLDIGKMLFVEEQGNYQIYNKLSDWQWLIDIFMIHIINRYGSESIEKWRFELGYNTEYEDNDEYNKRWKITYKTIKDINSFIRIGGDSFEISDDYEDLENHLLEWKNSQCYPDFLTINLYPYNKVGVDREVSTKRISNLDFIASKIETYENLLDQINYPKIDIVVSEWNTSASERNYYNDSCAKAAHVTYSLIRLMKSNKILTYYHGSDFLSQYYDFNKPLIGARGLITKDGIPKPIFFAFKFINRLGSEILKIGENYIVTTNGKGSYYILACNAKKFNYKYYLKMESEIQVKDLDSIFDNYSSLDMSFKICNIDDGKYNIKRYILNDDNGSILREWEKMNYISTLEKNDVEYLKGICRPRIICQDKEVNENELSFDINLKVHEITFIHIYK